MQKTSYFISGTDTDVGKTALTAALAAAWQARGEHNAVMKPIQTGATQRDDGSWMAPDLDYTLAVMGQTLPSERYACSAPVCYAPPCSPHLAARLAQQPVDLQKISEAFQRLRAQHDRVLVEGAGGLLVPINDDLDMLDLMRSLELSCVLAVRPNLGTLNHTQLSTDALAQAGLPLAGWVSVSTDPSPWSFIEKDNIQTLRQRIDAPCLGHIPYIKNAGDPLKAREALLLAGEKLIHGL